MRRTRFDAAHCPVARTTDLIGDWWTPIVLRELTFGTTRFNDIQANTGMSRAILTRRLERLVDEGLVTRVQYQDAPVRHEYRLTDKGRAFWDVLVVMWKFGDEWMFATSPGALVELVDTRTGDAIRPVLVDEATRQPIELATTRVRLRR